MKILGILLTLSVILGGDFSKSTTKKINKALRKSFNSELVVWEPISIDSSEYSNLTNDIKLYKLTINKDKVGYLIVTSSKGRYDYFDYMIIFNPDKSIRYIEILEYRSEHGYEVSSQRWLKQFYSSNNCDYSYGTNIDAISGATYSASSLSNDVSLICRFLINTIFK